MTASQNPRLDGMIAKISMPDQVLKLVLHIIRTVVHEKLVSLVMVVTTITRAQPEAVLPQQILGSQRQWEALRRQLSRGDQQW
jgi:hypothetical protein